MINPGSFALGKSKKAIIPYIKSNNEKTIVTLSFFKAKEVMFILIT